MPDAVLVVIGVGGMGEAIARAAGEGRTVLRADVDREGDEHVDVSDPSSVQRLAETANGMGDVVAVAHTAGLSPVQASADAIIDVDLLGVAHMLDAFGPVMAEGGAGVVISSMAGHMFAGVIPPDDEAALAHTPTAELDRLPCVQDARRQDPGLAYGFAKRANLLRVRAAAKAWGERGARINSISPGVITTSMGEAELAGPSGDTMRQFIDGSGLGRTGTAEEIAAATAFLLSPTASFITGTDLLVDGGVVASLT